MTPGPVTGLVLRAWHDGDADALPGLLDAAPDALWLRQSHALHGAASDAPRWRRTLVAAVDGRLVGAASVVASRVHPGRWPCAVEVAPGWRRRGIAAALLARLRAEHPQTRPLAGKVRPGDAAATGFVTAAGGRTYQRCPGQLLDPRAGAVSAWATTAAAEAAAAGIRVGGLRSWTPERVAATFAAQYRWVHRSWSPVPPTPPTPLALAALDGVAAATAGEVDPVLSSAAHRRSGGVEELLAVAFAFLGDGDGVDVVAEAARPPSVGQDPSAASELVVAVRACVARTLVSARARDVQRVELDGHADDPHLQPALAQVPTAGARPLLLVEVP